MEELAVKLIIEFYQTFGVKFKKHERWNLVLHRYFAFRLKYITVGRRSIRISKELSQKLQSHPMREYCFSIFDNCIKGTNLNIYQGKGLINADFHDDMFNDWGIHHLHLSDDKNNPTDFFVKRSDYLLFVRFTEDTAYMLDVYLHKEKHVWGKKALIKIIHDNWPKTIANRRTGRLNPDFTDEEIQTVRRKGYIFGINVNETTGYLMLGDSYACSGDNMMAGRMANEVHRWMWANENLFQNDVWAFTQQLKEQLQLH